MSATILEEPKTEKPLVKYSPADAEIAVMKQEYSSLAADTPKGMELCKQARAKCRSHRTAVEKRRVELKADALAWGRKVDAEAKRITVSLLDVEEPLDEKIKAVEEAKARAAAEKAFAIEAEQRRKIEEARAEEEARLKAVRDAEEARIKAEADKVAQERAALQAEQVRLAALQREAQQKVEAEQAAERKRLADEQARFAEERAKVQAEHMANMRAEWEKAEKAKAKLEAEQRIVDAERRRQEQAEFERQARIKAEQAAKEQAELDRLAAEEARVAEIERKAAEQKRLDAIRPDVEKVHRFAGFIAAIEAPVVRSREAKALIGEACKQLSAIVKGLQEFKA